MENNIQTCKVAKLPKQKTENVIRSVEQKVSFAVRKGEACLTKEERKQIDYMRLVHSVYSKKKTKCKVKC